MRRLTLTVTPEQAGRTVKSLLRRELRMADGAIARVKTVPDGICLNGAHARTVDRVAAGDTLTVRIDDKRAGGRFTPVAVPPEVMAVLQSAQRVSALSRGAFDVTVGAFKSWNFGPDSNKLVPGAAELARQRPLVDARGLVLDARAGTAFLVRQGMALVEIDLGGSSLNLEELTARHAANQATRVRLRAESLGQTLVPDQFEAGTDESVARPSMM